MHALRQDIFFKKQKNTWRYEKEEEEEICPFSSETDHPDPLPADARELCSAALPCAVLLLGTKTASVNGMIVAKQPRRSGHCMKMYQFNHGKYVWSLWLSVAKIDRNDHILFAFRAINISNILNENADTF